ncbi:MAG TPA: KilA-N domain-containing protein [Hanamia sp.]
MNKIIKMNVQGTEINITTINDNDYICLTDMVKAKEDESRAADIIKNWIRNRGTVEFLGMWEGLYNPNFKVVEFDHFRKQAGLPTFTLSVSNWVEKTNAIGIFSKAGKAGGTYAHKDIAFEFGAAISPIFKLYVIKEYQRLKEIEADKYGIEWDVKRIISKANYHIQTAAVKDYIVPKAGYTQAKEWLLYADEADLLNIVVFGTTAKKWRDANPSRVLKSENIRDMASINELAIISNLESLNSILIKNGLSKKDRFKILKETVIDQKKTLDSIDLIKTLKKDNSSTFIDHQKKNKSGNFDHALSGLLSVPPMPKEKK